MRSQLKTERITPNPLSWMSAPVKEPDGDHTFPSIGGQCARRDLKIYRAHINNGATRHGVLGGSGLSAGVPANGMNVVGTFIKTLSWRDFFPAFQVHHNGAFQHVKKRMRVVSIVSALLQPLGPSAQIFVLALGGGLG